MFCGSNADLRRRIKVRSARGEPQTLMLLLIPGETKRSEAGPREAEIKSKTWGDALRACELERIRVGFDMKEDW